MPIPKTTHFDCNDLGEHHIVLENHIRIICMNNQAELEAALCYIGWVVRNAFRVSTADATVQYKLMDIMLASFPIALCNCQIPIMSTLSLPTVFREPASYENDKNTIIGHRICNDWFLSDEKIKKDFNDNKRQDGDVSLSLLKNQKCGD